jgi:hypothetical protein
MNLTRGICHIKDPPGQSQAQIDINIAGGLHNTIDEKGTLKANEHDKYQNIASGTASKPPQMLFSLR